MWYTPTFAIHKNIGYRSPFSAEELAHDFLFLVVSQSVETDDAQGLRVPQHVSVHYLATFLALELLRIIFPLDAVLIKLEVVTFRIGAESDRFGVGEFFFHTHPIVFFDWNLYKDNSFLFVEVERFFREFLSDEQLDGEERFSFGIEQGDIRMMPFDGDFRREGSYLLKQVFGVFPITIRARPFDEKCFLLLYFLLEEGNGLLMEIVTKN